VRRPIAWLFLLLALPLAALAQQRDAVDHFFQPFLGDFRAEAADAKNAGKKALVVMFHFEECPYCARMKKEVLSRPEVQEFYRREFAVLGIDTRGAQQIIDFDGVSRTEKDYARSIPIKGTPTFIFYGLDGGQLYRHVGAVYDAAEFLLLGEYVASGGYRSGSFAQFRQSKKGS
jgi:thioredoxin-related protein